MPRFQEQKIALQKMEMLRTVLSALMPTPSSLAYFRTSPDSVIVSWESGQSTFACGESLGFISLDSDI